jgi:hypothetical protein
MILSGFAGRKWPTDRANTRHSLPPRRPGSMAPATTIMIWLLWAGDHRADPNGTNQNRPIYRGGAGQES